MSKIEKKKSIELVVSDFSVLQLVGRKAFQGQKQYLKVSLWSKPHPNILSSFSDQFYIPLDTNIENFQGYFYNFVGMVLFCIHRCLWSKGNNKTSACRRMWTQVSPLKNLFEKFVYIHENFIATNLPKHFVESLGSTLYPTLHEHWKLPGVFLQICSHGFVLHSSMSERGN